jgi:hypothetical protein
MIRISRAKPKSPSRPPKNLADAVQEKLDATPERLARAREAGETAVRDGERLRRILDPFDTMRANRLLAPHDQKLNDIRWVIGESLRRTHQRAQLDALRAVATGSVRPASANAPACRSRRRPFTPATSCGGPRTGSAPPPGRSSPASSSKAPE